MPSRFTHSAARFGAMILVGALGVFASVQAAQAQPTAPQNFAATAHGVMVSLTWAQANDFRLTYLVEAGSGPGLTDIGSFPLSGPVGNWYNFLNVPNGTYYLRLRAVLFSQVSAPSNEVVVTVTGCPGPLAPPALEGNVYGQRVVLQWRFPAWPLGCFASSLRLQAGSSPGAADVLDMNVPDWHITLRQFESVPFGTYYVRVLVDRYGVPSGPSNEVRLDVGCSAPPQILNPRAEVLGNAARFFWGYSNSQTADFSLVLEAGSAPGGAEIAVVAVPFRALTGFNVQGMAGTYYTRLRATNACGSTVSPEVPVTLTAECVAPDPIPFIDASMINGSNSLNLQWDAPQAGGLIMAYEVAVGSSPGSADLARRTVDGRYAPSIGFYETFPNLSAARAHLRVMPVNACGPAPRAAEAHANVGTCQNPPAPRFAYAQVNGNSVTLWWTGTSELESPVRTYVEIGTSPTASNVLTSPHISSYGSPSFTTILPSSRYYARARRLPYDCDEVSNASPEVTFVIP